MVNVDSDLENVYGNVAVIMPAFNEEYTVGDTVKSFRDALPGCKVVVCDNASTDNTVECARLAGADVIEEKMKGKGHAVRRLLATVRADIYVLSDADSTYDAKSASRMISFMKAQHLDLVTGVRNSVDTSAYRSGHVWGNALFNRLFNRLFNTYTRDIFSGYRVFSQRFARVLPIQSSGFEIEAEMTAIASILKLPTGEFDTPYIARPLGSQSKLRTYTDGSKILMSYFRLYRHFYPKKFYSLIAFFVAFLSLLMGIPVVIEYSHTGLVPRLPTAVLASSLAIISFVVFTTGIILESIARNRIEQRKLFFLLPD